MNALRDSLPKKEDIEKEKNTYSTVRTVRTVHDKEKRIPTEVRLRRSIHNNVMIYCALARMTAGQFYEEAAIFFMDVNPVKGALIVLEKPNKEDTSLKDKMLELMLTPQLEEWIGTTSTNKTPHPNKIKRLYKIVEKAAKIRNPSEQLQMLLEEALNRIE